NKKNDSTPITWTAATINNFNECKRTLAEATLLVHPAPTAPLSLCTDASDFAVGAVLHQVVDNQLQPMGFFSVKLTETQRKYSTYDRELLAIYLSIKHFRDMLEGRTFDIRTDHKPLVYAFSQKPEKASPRQLRQLDFISQFTTSIVHVAGIENTTADTLSRISSIDREIIDYKQLSIAQANCEELKRLLSDSTTALQLKSISIPNSTNSVICDLSTSSVRPFVPESLRKNVISKLHNISHSGAAIMCKNRMNWPQKLPMILLGLRSAFKPDIQTTSAQLVYGTTLRLPGEFF
ncbi:hypothetical protein KR059_001058, partial [Drosophila kikkawai]